MIEINKTYYAYVELFTDAIKVKTIRKVRDDFTLVSHVDSFLGMFDDFIIEDRYLYGNIEEARVKSESVERKRWQRVATHLGQDIHSIEDLLNFAIERADHDTDTIATILQKAHEFNLDVDKVYDKDKLTYSWQER